MKVLIVDDEPRIVSALDRALRMAGPREWEVVTATSGSEALAKLDVESADVIVSDMSMPEMDGSALLAEVRVRWPGTVRVVLSGHSDAHAAQRVASIAHQFYEKPIPIRDFIAALRHIEGTRERLVPGALRDTLSAIGDLPGAPSVFVELTAASSDPHVRIDDLTAIVSRDPALVAKLLQLVGSTFFARGTPVRDLRTAIGRLGVRLVAAMALSASAFKADPESGLTQDMLLRRAIAMAAAAQQVVTDRARAEEAFIAGLLADVGLNALACWLPRRVQRAREHARVTGTALHVAEQVLFGVTHAEVGAYILGLWRLPDPVVDAVRDHHADRAALVDHPLAAAAHDASTAAGLDHG